LQHYFASRAAMLAFAMDFASEQTSVRVGQGLEKLGDRPHPRDVLRLTLVEMLPLHADARATSRMSAAYVLEALHDEA
ncbi:TetR/AcrR family transcriptional regulator, partial [Streptomyces sp. SID7499]|nr:TetR/AcrR family transcriptional regulator [Streptomyces sp. SID7499]